ncbi:dTDP-4-amino-4,6-dideoxygalactose transaminase [Flavobacterium nitratireducens]|uniref:dTDP-4-amino-4,6-dideoxygalactose transaminase n=1 Tax=Flavobacterium nitratireducens TaxID=992289 RepID=UPI002415401E|nr:dTDP-4-amino-4,6-dideoxygalactose transaminase [Flavobacterium nitratireducens]
MKKILFNNIRQTYNFTRNLELLFSDYELIRKKHFSNLCLDKLNDIYPNCELFLTHSATGALEMIASLIDVQVGDEIIMPSFTFVATANAFVSKGATPVFIDINPNTLNIDETLIEQAITPKTKAVIAMHYAGHPCKMNVLKEICKKHQLYLIEDAAVGFGNNYKDQALGSMGDFGAISFDVTKHISAVQGGLLLINNEKFKERANNIYHLGTNRNAFQKGETPYYEWVDIGSKYQMNELNAAYLYDQLCQSDEIFRIRQELSKTYYSKLKFLEEKNLLRLIPKDLVGSNIHEFYIILNSKEERERLRIYLNQKNIEALFHYIPLHNTGMGLKTGRYVGAKFTEDISNRLLRLPFHTELTINEVEYITSLIFNFFFNK